MGFSRSPERKHSPADLRTRTQQNQDRVEVRAPWFLGYQGNCFVWASICLWRATLLTLCSLQILQLIAFQKLAAKRNSHSKEQVLRYFQLLRALGQRYSIMIFDNLTVRSYGYVQPLIRTDCSATPIAAPTGWLKAIRSWTPRRSILDCFRWLFPLSESTKLCFADNESPLIDQSLYARRRFCLFGIGL